MKTASPYSTQSPAAGAALFQRIAELARTSRSAPQFLRDALPLISQVFASPYCAVYAHFPSEVLEHDWHTGPGDPALWKPIAAAHVTDTLTQRRPRAQLLAGAGDARRPGVISAPLSYASGTGIGAVAVIVTTTRDEVRHQVALLESLTALLSVSTGLINRTSAGAGAGSTGSALAQAAAAESLEQFAYALTNGLRNKLACQQVALGLVQGAAVRLISISGLDEIKTRSPGVTRIRAAMEECLDAGRPILVGADASADGDRFILHRQWQASTGGAAVASVPLRTNDRIAAIVSIRRGAGDALREASLAQLISVLEPYAAALLLVREARRSVGAHVQETAARQARDLLGPRRWGRKVAAAGVLGLLAWFCFGTLDYTVVARAKVVPAEMRHISMPFDGLLGSAAVVAGDRVERDAELCQIDARDLEVQQAELRAERDIALRDFSAALAEARRVDAQLADARVRLVQAKLRRVERRLAESCVRSPYRGIVVSGDLRTRIGAALPQGEELFRIAPLDALQLEVEIGERDADHVAAGMSGRFVAAARPEEPHSFSLARVSPASERRQDRNVFVAQSALGESAEWLRPGMEGYVRIDAGAQPVWWIALHRVVDFLRVNFWL